MSEQTNKPSFWHIIRIVTTAPMLSPLLLVCLRLFRAEVFAAPAQFWLLLVCMTCLPLLAYPMQPLIPAFREKGRAGQRRLAMIFAFAGYGLSCAGNLFFRTTQRVWLMCLEYLLCGWGCSSQMASSTSRPAGISAALSARR